MRSNFDDTMDTHSGDIVLDCIESLPEFQVGELTDLYQISGKLSNCLTNEDVVVERYRYIAFILVLISFF